MKNTFKILFFTITTVLFSGCSLFTDGYKSAPPAPLVAFKPALKVQRLWSNSSSYGTYGEYLRLTPVVTNRRIYTSSYLGYVTAIDRKNGDKIWRVNAKVPITTGLALSSDKIFLGTGNGVLLVLNQKDGRVVWWTRLSGEILATPVVIGSTVLVKAENGELSAFSANSGQKLWTYKSEEPGLILRGSSSPQVFGNVVVAGFANGQLVALNLRNGRKIWNRQIAEGHGETVVQRMVDIDVNPQISKGVIYVATYQGRVAAVKLLSGQVLWQHKLSSYSGLAVAKGKVYVSDANGYVWAFAANSGNVVWRQKSLVNRDITGPAVIGDYLVVADKEGYVHFISQDDGSFVARTRVGSDKITTAPFVVDQSVYIYSDSGRLAKLVI